MTLIISAGVMAVAVLAIVAIKAHEIRSDNRRVSRGETPKYHNEPVYSVIDWTRRR